MIAAASVSVDCKHSKRVHSTELLKQQTKLMSPVMSSISSSSSSVGMHQQQKQKDLSNTRTQVIKRSRELLLERRDNILIIKINRPQFKNALNRNAVFELIAAFGEATHNADIQLLVITGVGDTFCAGTDLKQIKEYQNPNDYYLGANNVLKALVKAILACPKIIVCLVNGACIGIGFTLAALCDVVYCTRDAYFQTPFTQLGLCPEACSSFTFPQIFGTAWSTKLLLFNEKLSADKAENLGFVAEVYEHQGDVQDKLWSKLEDYSKLPWDSVRITKRLIRLQNRPNLMAALAVELKEIEKLRKGPVYQKAIRNFMDRSKVENKSKL